MKKLLPILIALLVALPVSGCSSGTSEADMKAAKPLDDIALEIKDAVTEAMLMKEESADNLIKYYGYDVEEYASYAIYNPVIIRADTIHIVEVIDIADIEAAKVELEATRARVEKNFESYLADPYEMAQNGKVVVKGRYAMLIISPDNEKAIEIFEGSIS